MFSSGWSGNSRHQPVWLIAVANLPLGRYTSEPVARLEPHLDTITCRHVMDPSKLSV